MKNSSDESRPSALWYLAPVAIVAGCIIVFLATLGSVGSEVRSDLVGMPRVAFPEGGEVELPEQGQYTIYYETRSVINDREIEAERPQRRIALTFTTPMGETEEATNIHWREEGAYDAKGIYNLPQYAGFAAWKYSAAQAGTYELAAAFSDPKENDADAPPAAGEASDAELPTFVVAVGDLDLQRHFSSWTGLFGAAAIVAVAMVIAVALAVLVYVKRNRARWSRSERA